jgi:hypothetical protein
MPKILIVPMSLCVDTHLQRSINAFADLGVSKFFMLRKWLTLNTLFDSYKNGALSNADFIKEISTSYPSVDFSEGRFESAWNAQVLVSDACKARFRELEDLEKAGIEIYMLSTTNPLHHLAIETQYGKPLPGTPYFSYQQQHSGHALLKHLLKMLKAKYPVLKKEEVSLLYSQPKAAAFANWGLLGWLRAPFQRWENKQATNYVAGLNRLGSEHGFNLLDCDFSHQDTIKEAMQQKGWLTQNVSQSSRPLRFNERYQLRSNPKPTAFLNPVADKKKKTVCP